MKGKDPGFAAYRPIFPAAGAEPYKRDLKTLEYHLLDTGHFALEEEGGTIARLMRKFPGKHVPSDFRDGNRTVS